MHATHIRRGQICNCEVGCSPPSHVCPFRVLRSPVAGARALKIRDMTPLMNEKDKQATLVPADNTFYTLAATAADYQV